MSSCGGSCSTVTTGYHALFLDTRVCIDRMIVVVLSILVMKMRAFKKKKKELLSFSGLCAAAVSWYREFKRLYDCIPCVGVQSLREHSDQVLHLAFSHRGHRFSSCSKDCTVKVLKLRLKLIVDVRK